MTDIETKAAIAMVVERAADMVRRSWDDVDASGELLVECIRALADPSGVEALAALQAERDALETAREMLGGFWAEAAADRDRLAAANAALEAQVEALRVARRDQMEARVEAVIRRNFVAPEDAAVEALCLRFGYGAVMDAAARLWARSDMLGAFYIGGCIGFRTEAEARAALAEVQADARRDGEGGE